MKFAGKEPFQVEGEVTLTKISKDGDREVVYTDTNLITKAGREYVLKKLYLAGVSDDRIVSLKVGNQGTVDVGGLFPKVEDINQTALNNTILTVGVTSVADLPNLKVTFLAVIDETDAVGQLISEIGLWTQGGVLFNVKNFAAISKTGDFSIQVEWAIRYV